MPLSKAAKSLGKTVSESLSQFISPELRGTLNLRIFGFLKIPVLFFVSPRVLELSEKKVVVEIPLNRRTKNHLSSMYFGVLAAGADCAGGLIAMRLIEAEGNQVSLIFKDFHADFLKRAEGNTHFTCTQGEEIRDLVKKALASGERVNMPVHITATVPSKLGDEPVAQFTLTLSLKKRS